MRVARSPRITIQLERRADKRTRRVHRRRGVGFVRAYDVRTGVQYVQRHGGDT